MINIPTTEILTPITGEGGKPTTQDHSETAEVSFQSVIAAEDIGLDALIPVSNQPLILQTHRKPKTDLVSVAAAFPDFITLPDNAPETVSETSPKPASETVSDPVLPPQGERLPSPLIVRAVEMSGNRGVAHPIVLDTPAISTEPPHNELVAIPVPDVLRPTETELSHVVANLTKQPPNDMPVLIQYNIADPTKEENAVSAAPAKRIAPTGAPTIAANSDAAVPKLLVNSSEGLLPLVDVPKVSEGSQEKPPIIQHLQNAPQVQGRPIESANVGSQKPTTGFVGDRSIVPNSVPAPVQGTAPNPFPATTVDQPDLARAPASPQPQNQSEITTRPEMPQKEIQTPVQGLQSQEKQPQPQPAVTAKVQTVQLLPTQLPPVGLTPQATSSPIAEKHSAKLNGQPLPIPQTRAPTSRNSIQTAPRSDLGSKLPVAETITTVALEPLSTPELMPFEAKSADSTSVLRHDVNINRPEVMRHVAQQLTDAARQMPNRPVELALNPEELGRVRLTFTTTDGGIHIAVMAERGETMDLLRRHIETLAQEFREMGYKDVNFAFSRNGQNEAQNGETDAQNSADSDTASGTTQAQTLAPVQLSLEPSAGLDLRL